MSVKTCRKECDILSADGGFAVSCTVKNGAIYPALCARKINDGAPAGVITALYIKKFNRFICLTKDGVYYKDNGGDYLLSRFEVSFTNPFFFEGPGGDTYLAGDTQAIIFRSDRNVITEFDHKVSDGAVKNGRLFAVDTENAFKLRWSGGGDGADWTEGVDGAGSVCIDGARGGILNVVPYKQKLALLCGQGIALFNAYGNPENFKLQYIDGLIKDVVKNSACVAGGKLIFWADGGLYSFDGVNAGKLGLNLNDKPQDITQAKGLGSEYYMLAKSTFLNRRVIYVINVKEQSWYVIDLPAVTLYENGRMHAFTEDGHYALTYGNAYTYYSGEFNFGTCAKKALTAIHFGCESSVNVSVFADGRERGFTGAEAYCRPKLRGKSFKTVIGGKGIIKGLKAYAEVPCDD